MSNTHPTIMYKSLMSHLYKIFNATWYVAQIKLLELCGFHNQRCFRCNMHYLVKLEFFKKFDVFDGKKHWYNAICQCKQTFEGMLYVTTIYYLHLVYSKGVLVEIFEKINTLYTIYLKTKSYCSIHIGHSSSKPLITR